MRNPKLTPALAVLRTARELERTGYDLPTETWQRGYVSWLDSGKRDLIIRGGRGACKSTSACIYMTSHARYAPWLRRPGTLTRGVIMSNTLQNGRDIMAKLKDMAERLQLPHEAASDYVRLTDRPWEFRLYANNPSSFLGIEPGLVFIDEADDESGLPPENRTV